MIIICIVLVVVKSVVFQSQFLVISAVFDSMLLLLIFIMKNDMYFSI